MAQCETPTCQNTAFKTIPPDSPIGKELNLDQKKSLCRECISEYETLVAAF